jgi:hypothetical protein
MPDDISGRRRLGRFVSVAIAELTANGVCKVGVDSRLEKDSIERPPDQRPASEPVDAERDHGGYPSHYKRCDECRGSRVAHRSLGYEDRRDALTQKTRAEHSHP